MLIFFLIFFVPNHFQILLISFFRQKRYDGDEIISFALTSLCVDIDNNFEV